MKTPEKNSKPDPKKQKKQLIALGALAAVFVAVMMTQFGGPAPQYEVAALAVPADALQPQGEANEAAATPEVKDNAVLSEPSSGESMTRSPFSNFWNAPSSSSPTAVPDVAAPVITVNATMPNGSRPMAVIDGELHFVGDSIGGWQLAEVRARAVVLRGPNAASQVVVDMPLLSGRLEVPAVTGIR